MKVYKFVHVQMNEFPEGNVKQHSHDESKTNRTDGSKASVVRLFSNHHGVLFYKIILGSVK